MNSLTDNNYHSKLNSFKKSLDLAFNKDSLNIEFFFETTQDFSEFGNLDDVLSWYQNQKRSLNTTVEHIPLKECRGWEFCNKSGSFVHNSGEFFRVEGYRTHSSPSREVVSGWDQPFLTQVGYDGGILGLIRKRFNGVPHYLCECKMEPGNYNLVQITTTIQATFSNLKRAHLGNKTRFSEYFEDPNKHHCNVLLDIWTSEDGGRLYNKRNRSMLVEHKQDVKLEVEQDNYMWLSLYQIKSLLKFQDAIISPHIRGIIATF